MNCKNQFHLVKWKNEKKKSNNMLTEALRPQKLQNRSLLSKVYVNILWVHWEAFEYVLWGLI